MSAIHGGDIYSREVKSDFSANLNPLGIPEAVRAAAAGADFTHYPDTRCSALSRAISDYEGVPEENIVCGNGAADVIYRIVGALRPKRALLCAPTFSEYERALVERDCAVSYHKLREEDGFALGEDILPEISAADMLFLCSPNNPVGNVIEPRLLERILGRCRECGVIAVVDECFLDFAEDGFSAKNCLFPNVIVIKAFTKICAMAGLRLGYALFGDERCAHSVRECGQPWSVSAPAQAAGVAAARVLSETDFLARTRVLIAEERDFLAGELSRLGFEVFPSSANFLLFKGAEDLAEVLLKRGIAIRSCRDYRGLDERFFRIAVRTHEENERLTTALSDIQKNRP
ncbi:MAG: pyridoxal phosphate-dependent aminotransferase [Oscillospiraceae bacterium]